MMCVLLAVPYVAAPAVPRQPGLLLEHRLGGPHVVSTVLDVRSLSNARVQWVLDFYHRYVESRHRSTSSLQQLRMADAAVIGNSFPAIFLSEARKALTFTTEG